ncbi:MAG: alpha/beta hydrolase, partial [Burkholderiales bacterium]|nr:alpha/beta hydrolase [Burkholderiales bacterium]
PARGFGSASDAMREARWRERVDAIDRLGPSGLAAERAPALCAPGTSADTLARVRAELAALHPAGYAQAAWMLSHDDLLQHLPSVRAPVDVLCGELDAVTPPASCEAIARAAGVACQSLPGVGHMAPMEDPARFNAALRAALSDTPAG